MEMDKELNDIIDKQAQLKAMERSLYDFAEKLKKQQDEFLVKHLNFTKDDKNVNVFEMIKRATKSKLVL